ncbi:MAG: toxin-antitoxin system HicB family antitoxin [Thiothrix sp.]|nr:toxin-antitoxin system HicB family antitoxin [Thiothrix sp.]
MSAITLRLPDDKHQRLKNMAEQRGISINQLLNEAATALLTDFDAEVRFRIRARRGMGKTERGIELLQKAMGD